MNVKIKTANELYDILRDEIQAVAPDYIDFSEGSMLDIITGAVSLMGNELGSKIVESFSKTFFNLAEGEDLDFLVVDHFGESFKRPDASPATGAVTFVRPNINKGNVTINAGTVVKTKKNATGQEVRFVTNNTVIMTGLTITVQVTAVIPGSSGKVEADKITVIESTLSDTSITVSNAAATSGGTDRMTDAEYREYSKARLLSLSGATEAAVIAACKSVSGVALAKILTEEVPVIEFDIATSQPKEGALFFRIPRSRIYVCDYAGNSSQGLIDAVRTAITPVKAAGVRFDIFGAFPLGFTWKASLELNPAGPYYEELSVDVQKIRDSMRGYIDSVLDIGQGFNKATADAYILSIWGPGGTGDINTFETEVPTGNVGINANQKLIADLVEIV